MENTKTAKKKQETSHEFQNGRAAPKRGGSLLPQISTDYHGFLNSVCENP
jgi:hypothetical protein